MQTDKMIERLTQWEFGKQVGEKDWQEGEDGQGHRELTENQQATGFIH